MATAYFKCKMSKYKKCRIQKELSLLLGKNVIINKNECITQFSIQAGSFPQQLNILISIAFRHFKCSLTFPQRNAFPTVIGKTTNKNYLCAIECILIIVQSI